MKLVMLVLTAAAVFAVPVEVDGQAKAVVRAPSGNAAVKYWQAFSHLPALEEKQEKQLEEWKTMPLGEETGKLLASARVSLQHLLQAAACPQVNWDLDFADGPGMYLPHLAKARLLGKLAALQIRSDFAQRQTESAVTYALALFRLARDAGSDPLLISSLVGYKIEDYALDVLAPQMTSLNQAQLSRLASGVKSLSSIALVRQAIVTEQEYMNGWLIRHLNEAEKKKPGSWREVWNNVLIPVKDRTEPYHQKIKDVDTLEKALHLANELMPVYGQLVQVYELPFEQRTARFDELLQQARKSNPLAAALLPAIHKVSAAENRYLARLALFQAAVAIVQGGPDKLSTVKDPFGSGSFEYKALEKGFTLTSKLKFAEEPVTYHVGK